MNNNGKWIDVSPHQDGALNSARNITIPFDPSYYANTPKTRYDRILQ